MLSSAQHAELKRITSEYDARTGLEMFFEAMVDYATKKSAEYLLRFDEKNALRFAAHSEAYAAAMTDLKQFIADNIPQ